MTFSPLSISFFIPLLIRVSSSHVAGGFLMEKESRKMYQHKPFSERLIRHMTLRKVTLVSIFSLAFRLVPVHHSCFLFCSVLVVMGLRNTIRVCRIPLGVAFFWGRSFTIRWKNRLLLFSFSFFYYISKTNTRQVLKISNFNVIKSSVLSFFSWLYSKIKCACGSVASTV